MFEIWIVPVPMHGQPGNWVFNTARKIHEECDRATAEQWMKARRDREIYCPKFCDFEIREAAPTVEWDL